MKNAAMRAFGGLLFIPVFLLAVAQTPSTEPTERSGHERMLAELRAIRDSASSVNPFFSRQALATKRQQVEALSRGSISEELVKARIALGLDEFRVGTAENAIKELTYAHAALAAGPAGVRSQIAYHLGLAHLRLGERKNCVGGHNGESCILPIRGGGIHVAPDDARRAIELFREVLAETPAKSVEHVAIRWLLNIAAMASGDYQNLPVSEKVPTEALASEVPFPRFPNVAPSAGLGVVDFAGGAVVEDLDGDGWLDVFTSSWAPWTNVRFFRNQGNGKFVEKTTEAGLEGLTGGLNLTHADYDNDGDADILVLRGAWLGDLGQQPNSLLENDGQGRFIDRTFEAGLGEVHYPTQTAAWADYDNDGDLDLYVGNEGFEDKFPAQLFRNNGNRTFTDVAVEAGVENRRFAKGVAWGDYNNDRFPDLFVSNYWHANRLYKNNRDGTFTDVAAELELTTPNGGFASWFWDYDNDGSLDIYSGSYPYKGNSGLRNLFAVAAGYLDIPVQAEPAQLYRGNGGTAFEPVSARTNLERITMPMGANFGDLDNDGFLDFYLGTGYPEYDGLIPNLLFKNQGGAKFVDVTTAAGVGHLQKGHGVVFADLDNDGDEDLFEQVGGFFFEDDFANALFENPGFGRRWIKLRLSGKKTNRSGIGARIRVEIDENGVRRSIHRTVGTGGSFGSDPAIEHIGLGEAVRVEKLEVYWPTSDTAQSFEQVAGNRAYRLVEGEPELELLDLPGLAGGSDS